VSDIIANILRWESVLKFCIIKYMCRPNDFCFRIKQSIKHSHNCLFSSSCINCLNLNVELSVFSGGKTSKVRGQKNQGANKPDTIQFLLQYWPSGSCKVDVFHLIWKGEIWLVFRWKNAHFPTAVYSTPNLKMFPLHSIPETLFAESIDTELIVCAKSFPLWPNPYPQ